MQIMVNRRHHSAMKSFRPKKWFIGILLAVFVCLLATAYAATNKGVLAADEAYVVSAQQLWRCWKQRLRRRFWAIKVQGNISHFDEFIGLEACTWGRKSCTNPQNSNTNSWIFSSSTHPVGCSWTVKTNGSKTQIVCHGKHGTHCMLPYSRQRQGM